MNYNVSSGTLSLYTTTTLTDLAFGLLSEFISRSVHAELQISTCSSYVLVLHWLTHRHTA